MNKKPAKRYQKSGAYASIYPLLMFHASLFYDNGKIDEPNFTAQTIWISGYQGDGCFDGI